MAHAAYIETVSFLMSTADEQIKYEFTCCDINEAVLGTEFHYPKIFAVIMNHAYNARST